MVERISPFIKSDARVHALAGIERHLQTPQESLLREHQVEMMQAIAANLAEGKSGGYIEAPTGSGKTPLLAELIEATGLRTLVLAPTLPILNQDAAVIESKNPTKSVGKYYAAEKNLASDVVVSTYQSALKIIKADPNAFKDFEMLVCDEGHLGTTQLRQGIYKQMPDALKFNLTATPDFQQVISQQDKGAVDINEEWLEMFQNKIYEMSIEEGMEREILTPLTAHIVKTRVNARNVRVQGDNFKKEDLERELNIAVRNAMVIGMVAGVEKIPQDVEVPADQLAQIAAVHEAIKGKQTAIFGISIKHVEELTRQLSEAGASAFSYHSGLSSERRDYVMDMYNKHKWAKTIVSVDALKLGWDSPNTEVGILMAPTQSGTDLVQTMGRVLRPNEGKSQATIVQLVDQFEPNAGKQILIPDVFSPDFVAKGVFLDIENKGGKKDPKDKPFLTISGISLESYFEHSQFQATNKKFIDKASVQTLAQIFDARVVSQLEQNPEMPITDIYRQIGEEFSARVSGEAQMRAWWAYRDALSEELIAESGDKSRLEPETIAQRKDEALKALLLLNLKTISASVANFMDHGISEDDLYQSAIEGFVKDIPFFKATEQFSLQINNSAKNSISQFIAEQKGVNKSWISFGQNHAVEQIQSQVTSETTETEIRDTKQDVLGNITDRSWRSYLLFPSNYLGEYPQVIAEEDAFNEAMTLTYRMKWEDELKQLPAQQSQVLRLRLDIETGAEVMRYVDIAAEMGVDKSRVGQLFQAAIRSLRRNNSHRLFEENSVFQFPYTTKEVPFQSTVQHQVGYMRELPQQLKKEQSKGAFDLSDRRIIYRMQSQFKDISLKTILSGLDLPGKAIRQIYEINIKNLTDILTLTAEEMAKLFGTDVKSKQVFTDRIKFLVTRSLDEPIFADRFLKSGGKN